MVQTQVRKHIGAFLSPLGWVKVTCEDDFITAVSFANEVPLVTFYEMPPILSECREELMAYFRGTLREFSVPVKLNGTEFQQRVWEEAREVPFGHSTSYWHLARRVENPKAMQAVAQALSKNPLGIMIPCHRIIHADGKAGGYAGGAKRKKWLIKHERELLLGRQGTLF